MCRAALCTVAVPLTKVARLAVLVEALVKPIPHLAALMAAQIQGSQVVVARVEFRLAAAARLALLALALVAKVAVAERVHTLTQLVQEVQVVPVAAAVVAAAQIRSLAIAALAVLAVAVKSLCILGEDDSHELRNH